MPLPSDSVKSVVFVIGERGGTQPIGTGVIVSVSEQTERGNVFFTYVVTAAHVVATEQRTWVRCRRSEDEVEDIEVPLGAWRSHWSADITAAIVQFGEPNNYWRTIPTRQFADAPKGDIAVDAWSARGPLLGDRVYFAGLLHQIPEMGLRMIPMTRSGTVGALNVERIPVLVSREPRHVREENGHLIDCRSFAGFSGAPCFIQFEALVHHEDGSGDQIVSPAYLLGTIADHLEAPDGQGERANAGVAVVVPVERLRELLMSDESVEERRRLLHDA